MTVGVSSENPSASRIKWVLLALQVLLMVMIYPPQIHGPINPQDDGIWLSNTQSVMDGKKLYRDLSFHHGPVLLMTAKVVFTYTEPTLEKVRLLFWVMNLLGLLCINLCLWAMIDSALVLILAALIIDMVPLAAHCLTIPMSARYGPAFLSLLFWPRINGKETASRLRNAALAGLLAGVGYWCGQEAGAPVFAAGAAMYWFYSLEKKRFWAFVSGFSAVISLGLSLIAFQGGLENYLHSAVIDIGSLMISLRQKAAFIQPGLWPHSTVLAWQNLADVLSFYVPAISCGIIIVVSLYKLSKGRGSAVILSLGLYGLLSSISGWARSDRWHIYLSLSPALVVWAVLADQAKKFPGGKQSAALFLFLVFGAGMTLPHAWAERLLKQKRAELQRPTNIARAGSVQLPFAQANGYEILVPWIKNHTAPGESIFYFPYNGAIYFLADRTNPARYAIPADALRPDQQQALIEGIESSKTRYIVWDTQNTEYDGKPVAELLSLLVEHIRTRFEPMEEIGPFLLLKRKDING